jgi:hypothetical protein
VHDESLSVVAVRVCNPDRSPAGINRRDAASTLSHFSAGHKIENARRNFSRSAGLSMSSLRFIASARFQRKQRPAAQPIRKVEPQIPAPSANDDGPAALGKVISKNFRNLESLIP